MRYNYTGSLGVKGLITPNFPAHYFRFAFRFQSSLQNCEKCLLVSSCLSVRPSVWNSAPEKFYILGFFAEVIEKIQVSLKYDEQRALYMQADICAVMTSRSVLLRMRNVSG